VCGQPGLRTRRRVCVSTTGGVCSPGSDRVDAPCLGGGLACAAALKAIANISCLVGTETRADMINKRYPVSQSSASDACLFLNYFFSSYTFSLTVIIATVNQLDGLSLLEACQM